MKVGGALWEGLKLILKPMTPREAQEQGLDWVYGNLAASTNHKPKKDAFLTLATERWGWTEAEFNKWAEGREWAT